MDISRSWDMAPGTWYPRALWQEQQKADAKQKARLSSIHEAQTFEVYPSWSKEV